MSVRLTPWLLFAAFVSLSITAPLIAKNKDKKKPALPEYVVLAVDVELMTNRTVEND